jgi:hypothetical protein
MGMPTPLSPLWASVRLASSRRNSPRSGEGRGSSGTFEQAGADVAAALTAASSGWSGHVIAVTHRYPILGYLGCLYGPELAEKLVESLRNGDMLEIAFDGDTQTAPVHRHPLMQSR